MDKAKYIDYKRLKDVMDTTIRDAEIKALFEGLKFSDLSYKENEFVWVGLKTNLIYKLM